MRIDSNQGAQPLAENNRSTHSSPVSADTRASSSTVFGEDSTQISGIHVQVQALVARALQLPEVRQEKVSALRQSVLGGSYQPSSSQVAEAVFEHMLVSPAA
jgi:flagellar biosynthesis anti-sigma factor FlgM